MKSKNEQSYIPEPATILKNEKMTEFENKFEFKFDSGKPLNHQPGQFVEVTVPGYGEAPISISSSPTKSDTFEMVVRKAGALTMALHTMPAGAKVGIRGPYGTSFPVEGVIKGKDVVFICGGIGLVPVRSAILPVLENRKDYKDVTLLLGCKTFADRLYVDEIEKWQKRGDIAIHETLDKEDPAWKGNVGLITTLLPKIKINDVKNMAVVVCGPPIMYKFVVRGLRDMGVPNTQIFLSLERRMKCGLGKCGHCQINGLLACQEGPVFDYEQLIDLPEALG